VFRLHIFAVAEIDIFLAQHHHVQRFLGGFKQLVVFTLPSMMIPILSFKSILGGALQIEKKELPVVLSNSKSPNVMCKWNLYGCRNISTGETQQSSFVG
jgi:hypothetical protein